MYGALNDLCFEKKLLANKKAQNDQHDRIKGKLLKLNLIGFHNFGRVINA